MPQEIAIAIAILGAIGGWTVTVVICTIWITGRLRELEKTIYREINKHREETESTIRNHGRRIERLEIKNFGFTASGQQISNGSDLS